FAAAVVEVASHPRDSRRAVRAGGEALEARPAGTKQGAGGYRGLAPRRRPPAQPGEFPPPAVSRGLGSNRHPPIPLRRQLDLPEAQLLDAQVAASQEGARPLVGELAGALELVRALVGAEVTGKPAPAPRLSGLDAPGIRHASHHTFELYNVPFMYPDVRQG